GGERSGGPPAPARTPAGPPPGIRAARRVTRRAGHDAVEVIERAVAEAVGVARRRVERAQVVVDVVGHGRLPSLTGRNGATLGCCRWTRRARRARDSRRR